MANISKTIDECVIALKNIILKELLIYHWPCLDKPTFAVRDKLELKAVKDGSASYAALERKAALYDKLVNGELSDEEDQEKYCVDFFRKGIEQDELPQPPNHDVQQPENVDADTDASFLFDSKPVGPGRMSGTVDSAEHKRNVRYGIHLSLLDHVIC